MGNWVISDLNEFVDQLSHIGQLAEFLPFYPQNKYEVPNRKQCGQGKTYPFFGPPADDGVMYQVNNSRNHHIGAKLFGGIGDGVNFLSPEIGYGHHAAITNEGCPCAGHIAVAGNKCGIYYQGNGGPHKCDNGASRGFLR